MSKTAAERAGKIRLIIFDVDGVLTDGVIWVAPPSASGQEHEAAEKQDQHGARVPPHQAIEAKGFSAHDGIGFSLARFGGLKTAIITRRSSAAVALRARDVGIDYVYLGQMYKMEAAREIMAKGDFSLDEIAYVGDDVVDLPVMRVCGLAIAPANARSQAKDAAHFVTPHEGGYGAGRDAIEFILEAKGLLSSAVENFLNADRSPSDPAIGEKSGAIKPGTA